MRRLKETLWGGRELKSGNRMPAPACSQGQGEHEENRFLLSLNIIFWCTWHIDVWTMVTYLWLRMLKAQGIWHWWCCVGSPTRRSVWVPTGMDLQLPGLSWKPTHSLYKACREAMVHHCLRPRMCWVIPKNLAAAVPRDPVGLWQFIVAGTHPCVF